MTEWISKCQTTLLNQPRGFAIVNNDGVIQVVNPVWTSLTAEIGLPSNWGQAGINILLHLQHDQESFQHLPSLHRLHFLLQSVIQGKSDFWSVEFAIHSNPWKQLALEISPYVQSSSSQIEGLLLTLTDITAYKEMELNLQSALSEVKTLRGLLPICAVCKKIKEDEQQWTLVEDYLIRHTHAEFTHDICPDCIRHLYPQYSSSLDLQDHSGPRSPDKAIPDSNTKEADC